MTIQNENEEPIRVLCTEITKDFVPKIAAVSYKGKFENIEMLDVFLENHEKNANAHSELITALADKDAAQDVEIAKKANRSILAEVATSGSYNDLSDKPSIHEAQVNSDWTAASGAAQILNKPALSTVATSGSYNDLSNKPSIPTKTSDLTNDSGFLTSTDILNFEPHSLKAYEDKGELLTDTEGLADVIYYAHSTYCGDQASTGTDTKKFTKSSGWSGTITTDGIASGFLGSGYLSVNNQTINANNPFTIKGKIITGSDITTNQAFLGINQYGSSSILIENRVSGGNLVFIYATGSSANSSFSVPCAANTEYSYTVKYDGTNLIYIVNGAAQTPIASFYNADFGHIYLGRSREGAAAGYAIPFSGSIDLKQFSITVDGVSVFAGNQTGTDTYTISGSTVSIPYTLSKTGSKIVDSSYRTQVASVYNEFGYAPYFTLKEDGIPPLKPTFTKVGNPTVTEDNVASGFSYLNYFTTTLNFEGAWVFSCKFKLSGPIFDIPGEAYTLIDGGEGDCTINVQENKIQLYCSYIYPPQPNTISLVSNNSGFITANVNYLLTINYDGVNTYTTKLKNLDNNTAITDSVTYIGKLYSGTYEVGYGSSAAFKGSIDLSSLEVKLETDYYQNFTVPRGNLYGMIERKLDEGLSNVSSETKHKIMNWNFPDYNSGIDIHTYRDSNNTYTCPSYGYIHALIKGGTLNDQTSSGKVYINGVLVAACTTTDSLSCLFPVESGDSVYFNYMYYETCKFYPMRGA